MKLSIGENNVSQNYHFTHSGNNRKINAGRDLVRWISTLNDDDMVIVEILNEKEFRIFKELTIGEK
ncbi:hypothetical protein EGI22_16150 [Lacihabitans sp. LS3-19]|uniref:hypothetical protein n=1 Tax=Lacihabitans sp. LS3-19 TaxID=2487335 RepID=UPI0020CEBA25|nr:hypothetical protein [Lacihabitans sp. LS3-19]MCP9769436.1 hypothetical protein [Lacihabitans sp. LS3-19]